MARVSCFRRGAIAVSYSHIQMFTPTQKSFRTIILLVCLATQSCGSTQLVSEQAVKEKLANVRLGQTTMAEVETTFGSANLKEKRLWVYNLADTSVDFADVNTRMMSGLIPPMPSTVSTNTRAVVTLRFTDGGTVKGLEVSRYFSAPYTNDYWYLVKKSSTSDLASVALIGESSGFKVVTLDFVSRTLNLEDTGSKARLTVTLDDQTLHIASTNPYDRLSNEYRIFSKRENAFTERVVTSEAVQ